jgi:hypothetical protein
MQTRQDHWRTFILVQNVATAEEGWFRVDETKRQVEMPGVLLLGWQQTRSRDPPNSARTHSLYTARFYNLYLEFYTRNFTMITF